MRRLLSRLRQLMPGKDGPTVDELIENLQADAQVIRLHPATVLGSLGNDAEPAEPFLIDLLETELQVALTGAGISPEALLAPTFGD